MGAQIVTNERSSLMASAWRQIAGIELANRILRHAQMTRASLQQTYQTTFVTASSVTLLTLASNVLKRVDSGTASETAWSAITTSPIPWRALFPAFRRLIRPFGPLRIQQGLPGAGADGFIAGLNNGSVTLVPPRGRGRGTTAYPVALSGTSAAGGGGAGKAITGGPIGSMLGPVPAWLEPWAEELARLELLTALLLTRDVLVAGALRGCLPAAITTARLLLAIAVLIAEWLLGVQTSIVTGTASGSTSAAWGRSEPATARRNPNLVGSG